MRGEEDSARGKRGSRLLTARFVGGKAPDAFIVDDGCVTERLNESQTVDLEDCIRNDPTCRSEDCAPSMLCDTCIGGRRYSLPWWGGSD